MSVQYYPRKQEAKDSKNMGFSEDKYYVRSKNFCPILAVHTIVLFSASAVCVMVSFNKL